MFFVADLPPRLTLRHFGVAFQLEAQLCLLTEVGPAAFLNLQGKLSANFRAVLEFIFQNVLKPILSAAQFPPKHPAQTGNALKKG